MVLMGEEAEAQFATLPGQACRSGWAVHGPYPNFALAGLWVPLLGLPACCLPSFPFCLRPGALFSCFPWRWLVKSPTGAHDHHIAGPGRYCPLGKAPGRTCLMLLCRVRVGRGPLPWLASIPPPPTLALASPSPTPGLGCGSFLSYGASQHRALQGVIWLPLVSERIILSVDCPFL